MENDEEFVFYYTKNTDLCSKLVELKSNAKNPFVQMNHWVNQQELDVEAMIEGIKSIVALIDKKKKVIEDKDSLEKDIIKLQEGKSTFKSFLSLKSKKDDLINVENQKSKVRFNSIISLILILLN